MANLLLLMVFVIAPLLSYSQNEVPTLSHDGQSNNILRQSKHFPSASLNESIACDICHFALKTARDFLASDFCNLFIACAT